MILSDDLIQEFAKLANEPNRDTSTDKTMYGTIIEYDNSKWVRIDGSDLLTPISSVTNVSDGDRVVVGIRNHSAIINGNLTAPSTTRQNVEDISTVVAGKMVAEEIEAEFAKIDVLLSDYVKTKTLEADYIKAETIESTYVKTEKLVADYIDADTIESTYVKTARLESEFATIENLDATNIEVNSIKGTHAAFETATTKNFTAVDAEIGSLKAGKADIVELTAIKADIGVLDANMADINTLIFGSASGTTIQTSFANAVIAQLGDAQIKSAMIENISAGKITAGDIITNNVRVKSEDGSLLISDETIQISDDARVRVQIGKDAAGDYSINIWDADGYLMFSEGGITDSAIKDAIIRNDMVSANADISASKLDIDSLFTEINGSANTIKSTKVYLDDKDQTLDVVFKSMTNEVDELSTNVSSQGTQISAIQGQISSKIWQQDIDDALIDGLNLLLNSETGVEYTMKNSAKTYSISEYGQSALAIGGLVVISLEARADSEFNIDTYPRYMNESGSSVSVASLRKTFPITTEWTKISGFVELDPGHTWTGWTVRSNANVSGGSTEKSVSIRNVKLELAMPGDVILSDKYSALEQTVNGISSTVASHTTQIASKADSSTVTTVNDKVTSLEQSLDGFQTTVRSTYVTQTEFDNLEIGGRNLLIDTVIDNNPVRCKDASISLSQVTNWTNKDGVLTLECSSSDREIYYRFCNPNESKLYCFEKGKTYTISGKAKITTKSGTFTALRSRSQNSISSAWKGDSVVDIAMSDTTEWQYFKMSHPISEDATGCYFSIQVWFDGSWTGTVRLTELQIEEGTVATSYRPAPEDMATAQQYTDLSTRVSQTESGISAVAKRTTDNETAISELELTADGLTVALDELAIGGRNLVAGTSLDTVYSGNKGTSVYKDVWAGKTIAIPTGTEYVVSFDAKANVAQTITCYFYSPNTTTKSESSTGQTSTAQDGGCLVTLTTGWKRYWVKWTQTAPTAVKNIIVGRNYTTDDVHIRAVKFEEGHVPSAWSPAPEDVETDISGAAKTATNFMSYDSTNGLLVGNKSSGSWVGNRAQITSSAFNILNSSGTKLASFGTNTTIGLASGQNVYIDSNSVDICSGSTVLASFTADQIDLGKNSKAAKVNLCGGIGTIYAHNYSGNTNFDTMAIESDKVDIIAPNVHIMTSNAWYTGAKEYSNMYIGSGNSTSGTRVGNYTFAHLLSESNKTYGARAFIGVDSYADYSDASYVSIYAEGDHGSTLGRIDLEPSHVIIRSTGDITCYGEFIAANGSASLYNGLELYHATPYIDFHFGNSSVDYTSRIIENSSGVLTVTGGLTISKNLTLSNEANGGKIMIKNSSGTALQVMSIGNTNNLGIGAGLYNAGTGSTNIYGGGAISLYIPHNGATHGIIVNKTDDSSYPTMLRPAVNGTMYLGGANFKWYKIYAANATVQTSDVREKENIVSLNDIHSQLFDRLQPVQFNFINTPSRMCYGLIAQEVVEAMEELGIGENELDLIYHDRWIDEETNEAKDSYGLAYNNLIALLIHEVQKLKAEVAELKTA